MRLLPRLLSRLSTRRRGRFAGTAVLLSGLLLTGGVYAMFAPASAEGGTADAATVAKGRELFLVGCAFCHGQNGEGVVTDRGTQYGPPLVGVGAAAVDFQVETGRMPLTQPGVQAPRKAPVYTPEETAALAAYVASLGPGPAVPTKEDYSPSSIPANEYDQAVVEGGEFFRTNCTACHNFNGSGGALPGGKYAPSLIGVEPKHIYEAMLTGPQQMPVFSDEVLKPEEKRSIIAYLKKNEETANFGGFSLGSLGPVAEGMFAWLAGIGSLVGFTVWIAAHTARSRKSKVEA